MNTSIFQSDLFLGVVSFTGIVLILVIVILIARSRLVSSGSVSIEINGDSNNPITVPSGSKLLQTLAENKIFLSSACGGGGTCSQCKCQVLEGGGSILPTEESHFNTREKNNGWHYSGLRSGGLLGHPPEPPRPQKPIFWVS